MRSLKTARQSGLKCYALQVAKYQATFPDELGIIVGNHRQQKDELDLILLEFRKLREGIISSGRADSFAVEVYETSAKLALLGMNIPQIASILPHLVKTLHKPSVLGKKPQIANLEADLKQLDLTDKEAVPLDTRARFLSYYLLHLICHMEDIKAFQHLLREAVSFNAVDRASDKVASSNTHIIFAMQVFHCFIRNDYAALSKVTSRPRSYDKFAWIIVRSAQAAFQTRAWQALKSSYMLVEDRVWVAKQLQIQDKDDLLKFLRKEKWDQKLDASGAILLKKG